jgi:hypothetical protein
LVSWPEGSWHDRLEIQADGQDFLRKWKRYHVVEDSTVWEQFHGLQGVSTPPPDLVAVVVVKPLAWRPSAGRGFLAALFAGMQTMGAAQPIQTYCSGTATAIGDGMHASVSANCTTYAPLLEQAPVVQSVWPSYVYGGSILVFDGLQFDNYELLVREAQDNEARYLHGGQLVGSNGARIADQPMPNPVLVALADDRGSTPLLTAAKRLRKAIETAEKARKSGKLTLPTDSEYEYLPPDTKQLRYEHSPEKADSVE